jgi:hypothetical protein
MQNALSVGGRQSINPSDGKLSRAMGDLNPILKIQPLLLNSTL